MRAWRKRFEAIRISEEDGRASAAARRRIGCQIGHFARAHRLGVRSDEADRDGGRKASTANVRELEALLAI